jgi:hypothetical protein
VLMMVGLGAHNKFRLVPALRQGGQAVGRLLRQIVRLELVGLILVLALTSFFGSSSSAWTGEELPCRAVLPRGIELARRQPLPADPALSPW